MKRLNEKEMVAVSVVSACVARTLTSPLDVMKIVGQIARRPNQVHLALTADFPRNILAFWTSNSLSCLRLIPYTMIKVKKKKKKLFTFFFVKLYFHF